jgi:DNA-binding transcriptional regulator YiaG
MFMFKPKQIRAIMVSLKIKRTTELAFRCGVTDDAVRKWLRGDRTPSGSAAIVLYQLAQEAGIKDKLMTEWEKELAIAK